jgi:hypothetical protein
VTLSPFRTVVDRTPWTMIRLDMPESGAFILREMGATLVDVRTG